MSDWLKQTWADIKPNVKWMLSTGRLALWP